MPLKSLDPSPNESKLKLICTEYPEIDKHGLGIGCAYALGIVSVIIVMSGL